MRREDFTGAYAPSIAAGEAVARLGRPDLAYGCWANAAGAAAAAGDIPRAIEFLDRAGAARARASAEKPNKETIRASLGRLAEVAAGSA
jgi:hypothetical protein